MEHPLFTPIEQPSRDVYMDFEGQEAGMAIAPHTNFFNDELQYWVSQRKAAAAIGNSMHESFAKNISSDLRGLILGRVAVETMYHGTAKYNDEFAGRWLLLGVSIMAHSRLSRRFLGDIRSTNTRQAQHPLNAVCFDFDHEDLYRGGIHAPQIFLDEYGLRPASGAPAWYETDDLVVRVSNPADPTRCLRANFLEFYGQPFDTQAYTSVVPRIKQHAWAHGEPFVEPL